MFLSQFLRRLDLEDEFGSQHINHELNVCVVAPNKEVVTVMRKISIFASRSTAAAGSLDEVVCKERVSKFQLE